MEVAIGRSLTQSLDSTKGLGTRLRVESNDMQALGALGRFGAMYLG
jgi:hypothetical protein